MSKKILQEITKAENHIKHLENFIQNDMQFYKEVNYYNAMLEAYKNGNDKLVPKIRQSELKLEGYIKRNPGRGLQQKLFHE